MITKAPTIPRYIAKLSRHGELGTEALAALRALPTQIRSYDTYRDIVGEGARATHCCCVEVGLVSRYKTLRNGARQIVSFHIPGDMIDLESALVMISDHGIRTHVPTKLVLIAHADILEIAAEYPEIGRAFWFDTLLDAAIYREWTVNVGRRSARERTAHLLLEFAARFEAAGMVNGSTFDLPVSQNDLADALGITPVHMNRTIQWLRGEELIRTHMHAVTIENWEAMSELAGFDPIYLHPEGPRQLNQCAR